ncbi:MAG: LysE family translocator [Pseudomonadota bacterium]|nr:LysE family translocator [Pseudomonadota bacterium]
MPEQLLPLTLFAIVAVGTPGPNNAMLLASGANFGVRRSLPHLAGVNLGFALMIFTVAAGLGATLLQFPIFEMALRIGGIVYLLYLAFRIATAETAKDTAIKGRPINFIEAALFQWINPKAWIMATGATVTYGLGAPDPVTEAFLIAAIFLIAGTPFSSAWMLGGAWLKRFLSSAKRRRAFNWAMALLLVASLLPVIFDLVASA